MIFYFRALWLWFFVLGLSWALQPWMTYANTTQEEHMQFLKKVNQYFTNIKTLQGRFTEEHCQITTGQNRQGLSGEFFLNRQTQEMRLIYYSGHPQSASFWQCHKGIREMFLLNQKGKKKLVLEEPARKIRDTYPFEKTPFNFILDKTVALDQRYHIKTHLRNVHKNGIYHKLICQIPNNKDILVTFSFHETRPWEQSKISLWGWEVYDQRQKRTTKVYFTHMFVDKEINPRIFTVCTQ